MKTCDSALLLRLSAVKSKIPHWGIFTKIFNMKVRYFLDNR